MGTISDTDQSSEIGALDHAISGDLSLDEIASITGLDVQYVRRLLYRGDLGGRKRENVEAWLQHRESNRLTRLPRVAHARVFNKWRD